MESSTTTAPLGKVDKSGRTAEGASDASQRTAYFGGQDSHSSQKLSGSSIEAGNRVALESVKRSEAQWEAKKGKPQAF